MVGSSQPNLTILVWGLWCYFWSKQCFHIYICVNYKGSPDIVTFNLLEWHKLFVKNMIWKLTCERGAWEGTKMYMIGVFDPHNMSTILHRLHFRGWTKQALEWGHKKIEVELRYVVPVSMWWFMYSKRESNLIVGSLSTCVFFRGEGDPLWTTKSCHHTPLKYTCPLRRVTT